MINFFVRGIVVVACALLLPLGVAYALEPGESIVLDPVTGNYMLTYSDELDGGGKILSHATFVPATKIVPAIDSKFHSGKTNEVNYSYSVSSGSLSRQILTTVRFNLFNKVVGSQDLPTNIQTATPEQVAAVFEANKLALATPLGWNGFVSTNQSGASRISWHPIDSAAGIPPKGHLKGFGFISQNLPGLGAAQFEGESGVNGYGGEGPNSDSDIGKQIQALEQNDFVPRPAAVPTIAVPAPFDAAVLLDRIRTHVATWPGKQLLDPAFATQLDRYLVGAADAYRSNQTKAGKENIETLRAILKKEHKDLDHDDSENENGQRGEKNDDPKAGSQRILIDRLAARILEFDLKYVLKRVDKN